MGGQGERMFRAGMLLIFRVKINLRRALLSGGGFGRLMGMWFSQGLWEFER
jgi:hypothetical protein